MFQRLALGTKRRVAQAWPVVARRAIVASAKARVALIAQGFEAVVARA